MIVDDDHINLEILSTILEEEDTPYILSIQKACLEYLKVFQTRFEFY